MPPITMDPIESLQQDQVELQSPQASKTLAGDSRLLQPGSVVAQKYRVVSFLGQGAMGTVYRVEQVYLQKQLALKTLNDFSQTSWRRFQKEAKTTGLLDHPAIVKIYDFGMNDQQPFFVMDLVEGETLSAMIKGRELPLDTVLEIFHKVCLGLGYAHSQGVIHRDIKPSNIVVKHTPTELTVKILDFGIAKMETSINSSSLALTKTGEIFGTPYYMSPEQCAGDEVDQRSDIYSLGCTLFEALTGYPPFLADTALATMMKHKTEKAPTLTEATLGRQFPPDLEKVVARLLAKHPLDRYKSLLNVAYDLSLIRSGEPIVDEASEFGKAPKHRQVPIHYAVAIACLCLVAGSLIALVGRMPKVLVPALTADDKETMTPLQKDVADQIKTAALNDSLLDQRDNNSPIDLKNLPKGYFSEQLSPTVRYYHFPPVDLGRILILDSGKGYKYIDGRFKPVREPAAEGEVAVVDCRRLGMAVSSVLAHNPELFSHFSPSEFTLLSFKRAMGITDDQLKAVTRFRSLDELDLRQTYTLTDHSIATLNELPYLHSLQLANSGISADGLLRLKNLDKLTSLGIGNFRHLDALIEKLSRSTNLEDLEASNTNLSPKSMALLAGMPQLLTLDLSGTELKDKDLRPFIRSHVITLTMRDSQLTPECLATFKKMPNLRAVYLSFKNSPASPAVKALFRYSLPTCKINWVGSKED